jgi:hypothetical protein
MSSLDSKNNNDSRNLYKKNLFNNYIHSGKTSREKHNSLKHNKINISNFLKRVLCYEQKKNYNLEKMRFEKLLEEKNSCRDIPNLTSRSIVTDNSYKNNPYFIKANEIIKEKKKLIDLKKNNGTIDKTKLNQSEYNGKRNMKKCSSSKQIKSFILHQEMWQKKINEKKNSKSKEIEKQREDIINEFIHPPITGRDNKLNKKNKYNREKIINDLYVRQNKLMKMNKEYLKNKYSLNFKPVLNKSNRYRNISSKYNKSNKSIIKKANDKSHNLSNSKRFNGKKSTINKNYKFSKIKKRNDNDLSIINKKKRINNSMKEKNLISLFEKINQQKCIEDKTYYLNINQSTPWNEYTINDIKYNEKDKEILNMLID